MSSIKTILIPYKASNLNSYVLEVSYNSIRFYTQQGIMLKNDEVYKIKSPYKFGDLFDEEGISRINYLQNADVLYLFHPNYPIKMVYRDKDNYWHIEDFEFVGGPWGNVNTSSARLSVTRDEAGDFINSNGIGVFSSGDVGKQIRLTITNNTTPHWVAETSYKEGDYVFSDNKYYRCAAGGTSGSVAPTHTNGLQTDGGIMWEYMHSGYGIADIVEFEDDTMVRVVLRGNFPKEFEENSTNYFQFSIFGGQCVYPMCGVFYRGRFAVMADINNIPTVYMSCSDDYNNFSDKEFGEVLDTNAITVNLYSNEYSSSCFLISSDVLFAGTTSGEFVIDSSTAGSPLSPSSVYYKQFSSFGSKAMKPQQVGASILYVSRQGVGLRNIMYSFENDGYESIDISFFSKHLLYSGIKKVVYQELPNKIIWIVTKDGSLVGLTYMAEQKVCAFHRHDLKGEVQDIAVIPNPYNNYEDLWLEVKRGNDYCVEWMDMGLSLDEEKSYFVDSGLSLQREFKTSFSEKVKETSGALKNKDIIVYVQQGFEDIYKPNGNDVREFIVHGEKNDKISDCAVYWLIDNNDNLNYNFELSENLIGFNITVAQFYTLNNKREVKVLLSGQYNSNILNFNTEIIGTQNHIQISFDMNVNKEDVILSGLDHIEGEVVKIMVNGAELPNQTVENGSVKVPYYAKDIVVGLPIESVYIPEIMYIQGNNGMGVGDVQRIDHITLMLYKSGGGKVGTSLDDLENIYFRSNNAKMNEETPLFSGNKTVFINSNFSLVEDKGASIVIYNDSIYPMNILAISPKLSTSGNGL